MKKANAHGSDGAPNSILARLLKVRRQAALTVLLGMVLVSPVPIAAQQNANDFKVFWDKFKAAVVSRDKNTIAALTKFPLGMSYGVPRIKTKAELVRRYREVFNQQTDAAKCFAQKEPEKDESTPRKFSIACPDEGGNEVVIFEFERGGTGWKFVRLDNINE